jgi:hypothetical protein
MKGTAVAAIAHEKISAAICEQLLSVDGHLAALTDYVNAVWQDDAPLHNELQQRATQKKELQQRCNRLAEAIETREDRSQTLVDVLAKREAELATVQAQIDELSGKLQETTTAPTREQLEECIREASARLLAMDREAGIVLRNLLDGTIQAMPYQQFGSDKVVLRAHFRLRLAQILPKDLRAYLANNNAVPLADLLAPVEMVVDLFEPSLAPLHATNAYALSRQDGMTLTKIGTKLGISKRAAHLAKQLGIAMVQSGITEPFIRLAEQPANASRWRFTKRIKIEELNGST